ncbi:MAG: VOC family protein [Phycisphaeraceae bacterium]|nr:VOC family protein [Phycisphaeraceae bacterium]
MSLPNSVGHITWHDYTTEDASRLRDFYKGVAGWETSDVAMSDAAGAYADYCMHAPGADGKRGPVVAGVCHARGPNAKLPSQWLMYITVADVAASAKRCVELGGKLLDGPRKMGGQMFCAIQDPGGAVCALVSP